MNNNYENYQYPDMSILNKFLFQSNLSNNMMNSNTQMMPQNADLTTPYDGFIRGNLFNSLYNQYKYYRPMKLIPNSEQAELLLNVDQLTFAAHELNLYLDVDPTNREMINLFNKYRDMANTAVKKYEEKYGPLTIDYTDSTNVFRWQNDTWPWEMGDK